MPKTCKECQEGDHENYDDDVKLTIVIDPVTEKTIQRKLMCREHREMYSQDDYIVEYE